MTKSQNDSLFRRLTARGFDAYFTTDDITEPVSVATESMFSRDLTVEVLEDGISVEGFMTDARGLNFPDACHLLWAAGARVAK